jgi:hypothetical protein
MCKSKPMNHWTRWSLNLRKVRLKDCFMQKNLPILILKYFLVLLAILNGFMGCFSYQENKVHFLLQDPSSANEKKNLHAWIKLVSLPEFNHDIPKEDVNAFTTYTLYKFVRELNQFERVNILYSKDTKLPENAIILEFQFSKLEEKEKFHPLLFPFGITGLAISQYLVRSSYGFLLYSLLGGPDTISKMDYSGNLIAYNNKNQEKARTPIQIQTEFNSNLLYYDKATESNLRRGEMLNLAIQNILKNWEAK